MNPNLPIAVQASKDALAPFLSIASAKDSKDPRQKISFEDYLQESKQASIYRERPKLRNKASSSKKAPEIEEGDSESIPDQTAASEKPSKRAVSSRSNKSEKISKEETKDFVKGEPIKKDLELKDGLLTEKAPVDPKNIPPIAIQANEFLIPSEETETIESEVASDTGAGLFEIDESSGPVAQSAIQLSLTLAPKFPTLAKGEESDLVIDPNNQETKAMGAAWEEDENPAEFFSFIDPTKAEAPKESKLPSILELQKLFESVHSKADKADDSIEVFHQPEMVEMEPFNLEDLTPQITETEASLPKPPVVVDMESETAKVADLPKGLGKNISVLNHLRNLEAKSAESISKLPLEMPSIPLGETIHTANQLFNKVGIKDAGKLDMPEVAAPSNSVESKGVQSGFLEKAASLPQARSSNVTEPISLTTLVERVRQTIDSQPPPRPRHLVLELNPPSLGSLQLDLHWTSDGWNVKWSVAQREIRDWLAQQVPALQQQNTNVPIIWHAPTLHSTSWDMARQHQSQSHERLYSDEFLPEEEGSKSEKPKVKSTNEFWA